MVDLLKYGFEKIKESETYDEYKGHNIIITVYHYLYKNFDGSETMRNTFIVSSQRYTSRAYNIFELEEYLKRVNIKPKI